MAKQGGDGQDVKRGEEAVATVVIVVETWGRIGWWPWRKIGGDDGGCCSDQRSKLESLGVMPMEEGWAAASGDGTLGGVVDLGGEDSRCLERRRWLSSTEEKGGEGRLAGNREDSGILGNRMAVAMVAWRRGDGGWELGRWPWRKEMTLGLKWWLAMVDGGRWSMDASRAGDGKMEIGKGGGGGQLLGEEGAVAMGGARMERGEADDFGVGGGLGRSNGSRLEERRRHLAAATAAMEEEVVGGFGFSSGGWLLEEEGSRLQWQWQRRFGWWQRTAGRGDGISRRHG